LEIKVKGDDDDMGRRERKMHTRERKEWNTHKGIGRSRVGCREPNPHG
jgi:hypothetical protein